MQVELEKEYRAEIKSVEDLYVNKKIDIGDYIETIAKLHDDWDGGVYEERKRWHELFGVSFKLVNS